MTRGQAASFGAGPAAGPDQNGLAPLAPRGAGSAPRHGNYAAIDLGTNNCRLLIARPTGDGFTVVDAFSRVVRLGEGLAASGRLNDGAIDRALSALSVCADKLCRRRVTLARSVATEACRRASNGDVFIERVYRETGIMLDIITAREEARLAVLGCQSLIEPGEGHALVFDIGGGSTELVLVDASSGTPQILDWHSAPWGVVSLMEKVSGHADTAEGRAVAYADMRATVADAFSGIARRLQQASGPRRLLGTSGTVTTLASVHLGLDRYDRQAIDGLVVETQSLRAISQSLSAQSIPERRTVPCIGTERADLVVAGCAILESIFDIWQTEHVSVADRGIREGILRSLIESQQTAAIAPNLTRSGRR